MTSKSNNFFKKNYDNLINSIKNINVNIVIMTFYDLLFYSISGLLIFFGFKHILKKYDTVPLPGNALDLGLQQAEQVLSQVKGFYFLLILTPIIIFLLVILAWSLFKGLNWSIALKKKFNLKYFKRLLLLNIIWLPLLAIILILVQFGIRTNAAPIFQIVILAIAVYLTNILYVLFTKQSSIKAVKKTFALSLTKIHYFIFPYAVIAFILSLIFTVVGRINLQYRAALAVSLVSYIIVFAWARLYIVEVVQSID